VNQSPGQNQEIDNGQNECYSPVTSQGAGSISTIHLEARALLNLKIQGPLAVSQSHSSKNPPEPLLLLAITGGRSRESQHNTLGLSIRPDPDGMDRVLRLIGKDKPEGNDKSVPHMRMIWLASIATTSAITVGNSCKF
jgi:hypothetical protein